ncbi:DUF3226 domain-containing protein [Anaerobutyricum soehngenii]|uniref:DUF3226 domain-containing protein n=1 Tax=Anaerobutyricum soehngenii TaxID=105843 RepID=UPI003D79092C
MKSIIICEGSTDYVLLQYFMRKAYGWKDSRKPGALREQFEIIRELEKESNSLLIGGAGGCSRIISCADYILKVNNTSAKEDEKYTKIVVVTDRDEVTTEEDFLDKFKDVLDNRAISYPEELVSNQWMDVVQKNGKGKDISIKILLLIIPFEETGAMETFLLKAISDQDEYDKRIIEKGNYFVDEIDPEKRYLNKRRYITKAKFDVYFSVRTSVGQFRERQNILKNIKWENYTRIQNDFRELAEL